MTRKTRKTEIAEEKRRIGKDTPPEEMNTSIWGGRSRAHLHKPEVCTARLGLPKKWNTTKRQG